MKVRILSEMEEQKYSSVIDGVSLLSHLPRALKKSTNICYGHASLVCLFFFF